MKIIVTGGSGFIGSALIRTAIAKGFEVVNIDCLTYAANPLNLHSVSDHPSYHFEQIDICNESAIQGAFDKHQPDSIVHLAAESHVDRSIDGPSAFIQTNIVGTYVLLNQSLAYWNSLNEASRSRFRFHHVSTDEVYGDLSETDPAFVETTPYSPSSPYSASKAASDHLVRAWGRTYNLPTLITNCSNNYGPYQFPEKLIPVIILKSLAKDPIPVYGEGKNIRDWLFVDDHADALLTVLKKGHAGETYNIGGNTEMSNIDLVRTLCRLIGDRLNDDFDYESLITYVTDRPGHDRRYAVDTSKIFDELEWTPLTSFEEGLNRTLDWYLTNESWWIPLLKNDDFGKRLGTQIRGFL